MRWGAALLVFVVALLAVASATAADPSRLTGERLNSGFYPCPDQADFNRAPLLSECTDPPPTFVTADCDPNGVSTITVSRSGDAFGAPPLFNGTFTETITATIGPQSGPPRAAFAPFVGDGMQTGSIGIATGELLTFDAEFTITAGSTTIEGTKSLVANAGNWGVCRGPLTDEPVGGDIFQTAPLTGHFHMLNAGVLSYEATITDEGGTTSESGVAEAYLLDTFATCCDSANPASVSSAIGQLGQGFGTTHPEEGTSGTAATDAGSDVAPVTVEPLGGVVITFSDVTATGATTAVLTTSVPELPSGFQVGDPPAFYEIATTAGFQPPITVCLPYGALPAGTEPVLLHYENGAWEDRTTSFTTTPAVVCGEVSSLSPFAAVFEPVSEPVSPSALITDVKSQLATFLTPTGTKVADKIEDVIAKLDAALAKLALPRTDRQGAAGELEAAAGDLEAAVKSRLLTSAQGVPLLTGVAEVARLLAEDAIGDAEGRGGNAKKIAEARSALAAGDTRLAAGRFKDAVAKYKDAVSKAEGA